ncbi:MAG: hypothetical protein ABJF01_19000 [bacterium]
MRFLDGTQGEVDLSHLVSGGGAGVFERLRDPGVFAQVGIEHGAVAWPGELDLAQTRCTTRSRPTVGGLSNSSTMSPATAATATGPVTNGQRMLKDRITPVFQTTAHATDDASSAPRHHSD